MHPWLIYTPWFRLPTYFTCLVVGFLLATVVARREARRSDIDAGFILGLCLWMLPTVVIGSRLADLLFVSPRAAAWPSLASMTSVSGGFVFYGGVLAGAVLLWRYSRHHGHSPWRVADVLAPATAFGLALGRVGCLGGGCCYGKPADFPLGVAVPWAVRYYRRGQLPEPLLATGLHPAPLYASALALCLFVGLSWMRGRQRVDGQVVLSFLIAYGLGRSVLEVFRGDAQRGLYFDGWLSTSQGVGLFSAALAGAWLVQRWRAA